MLYLTWLPFPQCASKAQQKGKKYKPPQEPVVTEPELGTATPDASAHEPPPQSSHDVPISSSDPPTEQTLNDSGNPKAPSPAKENDQEVEILKT